MFISLEKKTEEKIIDPYLALVGLLPDASQQLLLDFI